MQPYTGHLKELDLRPQTRKELLMAGYREVPEELEQAAKKKLAGQKEAMVSLTSGGKLSKWAAGERKKERETAKKNKKKMAKKSRQANRK